MDIFIHHVYAGLHTGILSCHHLLYLSPKFWANQSSLLGKLSLSLSSKCLMPSCKLLSIPRKVHFSHAYCLWLLPRDLLFLRWWVILKSVHQIGVSSRIRLMSRKSLLRLMTTLVLQWIWWSAPVRHPSTHSHQNSIPNQQGFGQRILLPHMPSLITKSSYHTPRHCLIRMRPAWIR